MDHGFSTCPGPDCDGRTKLAPDQPACPFCKFDALDYWLTLVSKTPEEFNGPCARCGKSALPPAPNECVCVSEFGESGPFRK